MALFFLTPQATPQTARDYYNEIYKAGGLDRMVDGYVCFDEDPTNQNFFLVGESKHLRESMISDGTFDKLPKDMQTLFKKDFLMVRGYAKGIAFDTNEFLNKDGASWITDDRKMGKEADGLMRIRLSINWETLRYKRAVELLNPDSSYRSEIARFGRCEEVKPDIRQHGN